MAQCSIIIPVYNKASLTRQCLNRLLAQQSPGAEVEIIVVDDGSVDLTPSVLSEYVDRIQVITHRTNQGFAVTCNDGATAASGEYLVFLNNDTLPLTGWLKALVDYAESHPAAAVVGSKLLFPNDTVQHAGVVICQDCDPRHIYAGFPADHPAVNRSRRFQIVTAACQLVRSDLFRRHGGFDVAFRNGYEDVDLCLRLGESGHEVHYCHESVVYHLESAVTKSMAARSRDVSRNYHLYRARWGDRVRPDDLRYYMEDGLLKLAYSELYPVRLDLSPLLGVVDGEDRDGQADRLIHVRSRQVFELMGEVVRLSVRLQEAGQPIVMTASESNTSRGSRLEIQDVCLLETDPQSFLRCAIDEPAAGIAAEVETVAIAGWVLGRESAAATVELIQDGAIVGRAAVKAERPDVARDFPDVAGAASSGFHLDLPVTVLAAEFELSFDAIFANGSRVSFGVIRGRHEPVLAIPTAGERRTDGPSGPSLDVLARSKLESFLATGGRLTFPKVETPEVSIVVLTCLQQAHYLYQFVESLLASEPELAFELIVVDNASTDETPALLQHLENVRHRRSAENLGFPGGCNLGAQMARGRFLCFLNNDTLLTPGSLSALVRTMEADPECGAVGAKLIHPDGRLQEAGSIVWRDGSALGYGRGEDPRQPEYCYAREVDYCSAACLLVRRDVFESIGRFDEQFSPGYYEDTDLCFAIQQAGYTVRYQPLSAVYHVEFGSRDEARGLDLQRENLPKFVAKWRERLDSQMPPSPHNILRARDRCKGLRVLVVDDRIPLSGMGRGYPRAHALLRALVDLGHALSYLPVIDRTPNEPALTELQQAGVEVLHSVENVEASLQERAGLYDLAVISRPHNAWTIEMIKRLNPAAAIVYDAEAVFAQRQILQAQLEGQPLSAQDAESRIRSELALTERADAVMTVSEPERRLVQVYNPTVPVYVWGDSMRIAPNCAGSPERRDLLFVGALSQPPNIDAAICLLNDVFPSIRARLSCRLFIIGANPSAEILESALSLSDSVILTGFLNDLAPVYERARVFLAPHRFAAGTPHKVIEAMAHGVPCVVSPLLANQLEVTDGVEVLVGTDAHDFAEKVIRLYGDEDLWHRVQANGYTLVQSRYDPALMEATLRECIEEATGHGISAPPASTGGAFVRSSTETSRFARSALQGV